MTKFIHRDAIVPAAPRTLAQNTAAAALEGALIEHCEGARFDAAAQLLLRALGAEVRGFLRTRTRERASLEEVFAVFSEDVWRGLPGYRFKGRLRAWVYTLARNALARHIKSKQRWRTRHVAADFETVEMPLRQSLAWRSDRLARLTPLLSELSGEDRRLIEQRLVHALSWREIAHAGGAADVARASARLRKRFQTLVRALRVRATARRSIA